MMNLLSLLPRYLKAKRKACGLTLAQVSERTGLSVSFLSDIETGRAHPSLETLIKLAECYQTSIAELCIEAEVEGYVKQVRVRALESAMREIQNELEELSEQA